MNEIEGPYYTLSEAKELLKLRTSELRFKIEKSELRAVVYTKTRRFLLFKPVERNQWNGYATCNYRGHFSIHKSFATSLIDGEKIKIGNGYGQLLDMDGISDIAHEYPFKVPMANEVFSSWSCDYVPESYLYTLSATPAPREFQPPLKLLENLLSEVSKSNRKHNLPGPAPKFSEKEWDLEFQSNSIFDPKDLRVPASEIDRFQIVQSSDNQDQAPVRPLKMPKGERENQLHSLIARIVVANSNVRSKQAWRLIEEDYARDEPVYDTEHILMSVDAHCIEWTSRHGTEQSLLWKSFPPLLSKLRKHL